MTELTVIAYVVSGLLGIIVLQLWRSISLQKIAIVIHGEIGKAMCRWRDEDDRRREKEQTEKRLYMQYGSKIYQEDFTFDEDD